MTTIIGNKISGDFFGVNLTPETSMHALTRDSEGLLTYTKINLNSSDSLQLSNGNGLAYESIEEFVDGVTASGVPHNTIPKGETEISRKNFLGKDYNVVIKNPNTGANYFEMNDSYIANLDIIKGATYRFFVNDTSTQGYPLFFSTTSTGGSYNDEYLFGVTNSRASYGGKFSDLNSNTDQPLTITVPNDAPDILYLLSGNHNNLSVTLYTTRQTQHANLKNRNYDQVRFDDKKVTYFINSDGFLVARYNSDYIYS